MGAPWEMYQQNAAPASKGPWSKYGSGGTPAEASEPPKQINYQDATDDPTWIKNARTLYKEVNKADPKDDYEATNFLKDYLYDFNYRLAGSDKVGLRNTFGVAGDVGSFSPEGKQAFLDAQQQFEGFDVTLPGVLEAGQRVITDPTTYLGLGGGTVVKQGVKEGIKETAKQGLKRGLVRGIGTGATEGAVYAGASDLGQQQAQVNAGGQEAIDYGQLATNAGIGAGVGGAVGGVVGGGIGYKAERNPTVQAARRIVEDPEVASRGAEITMRMADLQDSVQKLSPEAFVGKEQVNANLAPLKGDVKSAIDQMGLDKNTARKLKEGLDKASGISEEDIAKLRSMPGGDAVAENIMFLRQANAMTRPIPNDGLIPKLGRFALDKISPAPWLTDPIKSVLFPARISGELRVANLTRDRKIAEEILRLQGPSKATSGRQWLLDQGLKMAKVRQELRAKQAALDEKAKADFELRRDARKAEAAKKRADAEQARSDKLKKASEAKAAKSAVTGVPELDNWFSDPLNKATLDATRTRMTAGAAFDRQRNQSLQQNVKTNTGLGKQQNTEVAKQAQETTRSFEEALSRVNSKMAFENKLNQQRMSQLKIEEKALAEAEASVSVAKGKEGRAFDQALRKTTAKMKSLAALEKFKQRELARQVQAAQAGEEAKPIRSRKFTTSKEQPKTSGDRKETSRNEDTPRSGGSEVRNPISYQAGTDTILDFQRRALDAAERQPDKKVGQLLKRAVEDMVLAKNDQQKRQAAYDKAADAALELGGEALDFIDENLYFLVKKYQ
jgi:hypothetical protein